MILRRREHVPNVVTCGLNTVGVRCPKHPVTLEIIRAANVPVDLGGPGFDKARPFIYLDGPLIEGRDIHPLEIRW